MGSYPTRFSIRCWTFDVHLFSSLLSSEFWIFFFNLFVSIRVHSWLKNSFLLSSVFCISHDSPLTTFFFRLTSYWIKIYVPTIILISATTWDNSGTARPSNFNANYLQTYAATVNTINAVTNQGNFINHAKTRMWYPANAKSVHEKYLSVHSR